MNRTANKRFCTTLVTKREAWARKTSLRPPSRYFITDRFKAVALFWFISVRVIFIHFACCMTL